MSLYGMGNRSIKRYAGNEIDTLIENAGLANVDIIELQWRTIGYDVRPFVGLDVPTVVTKQGNAFVAQADYDVIWNQDGVVRFYPDENGRKWAYLSDTPRNRKFLAETFFYDWFVIVDGKIKEQIKDLVEKLGVVKPSKNKYDVKVKEDKYSEQQKMLDELIRKNKELEEALTEANKPLKGIRIDKPTVKNI